MTNFVGRDFQEKRNYIRMKVDTPAKLTLNANSTQLAGLCRDLSGGGLLVELSETLPVGTRAEVVIASQHGHSPMLKAQVVVRRVVSQPDQEAQPCLLGMEILEVIK